MNKKVLITGLTSAVIIGSLWTATRVAAQESIDSSRPMDTLALKIANKFGLNQSEVEAVLGEARQEHQQLRQAQMSQRLEQLVTEGKITQAQKELIEAKHQEMQAARLNQQEAWKSMTRQERQAQMEQKRSELKAWAEENGIDTSYLMMGGRQTGRGGFGPGKHQI